MRLNLERGVKHSFSKYKGKFLEMLNFSDYLLNNKYIRTFVKRKRVQSSKTYTLILITIA